MLKQMRTVDATESTASTPEMWAANFANSTVITHSKIRCMQKALEWSLISRYIPRGSAVLDAGCGFGEWVQVLGANGYSATGVDYSPNLVGRLQRAYPTDSWIHSDVRQIPVCDQSFDAVISWGVIEHDEAGPDAALREFHRILRPQGVLIVSVPIDSPQQRRATSVLFKPTKRMAFYQYAMTCDELKRSIRSVGFEILRSGTIPGAAFAMMTPRMCMWARERGRLGRVLEAFGSKVAAMFRRYHLMVYTVGRKAGAEGP